MKKLLVIPVLLTALLAGCTSEAVPPEAKKPNAAKTTANAVVHDVKCGCAIDEVGKCGNYILVDAKFVQLVSPTMGDMEFCKHGAAGAKIETKGEMKDGKFHAQEWKLVQ